MVYRFFHACLTFQLEGLEKYEKEAVLHARIPKPRRDILVHPCFTWFIVLFTFVLHTHLYHNLYCEPRPVSHARLAVGLIT